MVAIKSKELIDKINPNYKNKTNIKYILTEEVDDFAKVLSQFFHSVTGEYIVLFHSKTINKYDRIREQVVETRTYKCNVMVSELEILDDKGERQQNLYLIDQDYSRSLDLILFSLDFRLEASIIIRKIFLAYIFSISREVNRYSVISQIVKYEEINFMYDSYVQISLKNYQDIFVQDSIIQPQQDHIKFMHYNSYLNKKDIKISTTQFSKLLNCSYDYLGCDEATLDIVRYLMIDSFLTYDVLYDIQKLEFINQIELIHTHLYQLEHARSNPEKYPLVSVLMSTYNRDYYLLVSVQHVLQQTYVNWELIISDNGSSNPITHQILQLIQRIPRVRVLYLQSNQNSVFALNYALKQSKGEYIAIQDDDDIMMPFRLEYQINFLRNNPEYQVCASAYIAITETGIPKYYTRNYDETFAGEKTLFMILNSLAHNTFVVRMTDQMKRHFIYDHQTPFDLSLRFILLSLLENEDFRFFILPRHVTGIRDHSQKMSHNSEYYHFQKWISLKQIEISERLFPDIFENVSFQQYTSNVNNVEFEPAKLLQFSRIIGCICHQGNLQKLLTHIEQLEGLVDNFIIVYILNSSENQIMQEINDHPLFQNNHAKNTMHIINMTGKELSNYIEFEIPKIFTNLLEAKNLQDHDYILLSNTSEFINPFQLKRFYQLSQDFGIFGLRYLQSVDKEDQIYQMTKIISYHLFKNIGYKAIREYEIDENTFKLVPRFEDKLYTLFINGQYLNVYTMKDSGIFIDDCESFKQSLDSNDIQKDNALLTPSEKRKFENFYISSLAIFQPYCGINIQNQIDDEKSEL
ncbi:UNKNOWN [Stylonychia lemnae]|uniref:Glycosyltransferase 2-like domain-containing protein n=1 Tax=Stylonychia lemnae TaxID=5949 RepID=A0A078A9R0_STYLE|nr:UNKNOWN [Stylonychia lemnae]|eukprot:CDW79010.1 UNKNOWN [Stylonychia lemnae]